MSLLAISVLVDSAKTPGKKNLDLAFLQPILAITFPNFTPKTCLQLVLNLEVLKVPRAIREYLITSLTLWEIEAL